MNASPALVAVVGNDDVGCISDTVYHTTIDNTLGGSQPTRPSIEATKPSNAPTTLTPPELDPLVLKDQRSHERARQRLKKPGDISKSKRVGSGCSCCRRWDSKVNKATTRSVRGTCAEGKAEAVGSDMSDDECGCSICDPTDHPLTTVPAERSVSLLDLVKPQKKGAGMSLDCQSYIDELLTQIIERQFEVVDRPRQVLLLDDFTEIDSDKYDLDDWEHVESGPKQRKAAPKIRSYATVVAARA
ncbi:hypothetical protein BU17DRAFT_61719 [Hysterangium stoloniferum]|nr:hypothetical protein BU17DRAFT_61719 [Hysterangium stoloniferum]